MSTTVHLLYRDACNYKTSESVVFNGDATPELVERLFAALDDGENIVPEQVGLEHPALKNDIFAGRWPDEEDDHGYSEILRDDVEPGGQVTDDRTFEQFVEACEQAAAAGWDPMVSINANGGWQDPEHCARLRGGSDE